MNRLKGVSIVALLLAVCSLIFFVVYNNYFKLSGFAFSEKIFVSTHIDPEYSKITSGGNIVLGVSIVRLGAQDTAPQDVEVEMSVASKDEKKILLSSQTAALGTQLSMLFHANLPEDLKSESYVLHIDVKDSRTGKVLGSANQRIIVVGIYYVQLSPSSANFVLIGIALVLVVIILVLLVTKFKSSESEEQVARNSRKILSKGRHAI